MTEFHDRIAISSAVLLGLLGVVLGAVFGDVPRALAITAAGLPLALIAIALGRHHRARAKAVGVEQANAERVLAVTLDLLGTPVERIQLSPEEFGWMSGSEAPASEIRLAELDDGQVVVAGRTDDLSTVTVHVRRGYPPEPVGRRAKPAT
jgi:hypothetical protein